MGRINYIYAIHKKQHNDIIAYFSKKEILERALLKLPQGEYYATINPVCGWGDLLGLAKDKEEYIYNEYFSKGKPKFNTKKGKVDFLYSFMIKGETNDK